MHSWRSHSMLSRSIRVSVGRVVILVMIRSLINSWYELIMFCCFVLLKSNCNNMFVFTLWKLLSRVGRSSSR
ncbi:hypothetical protein HanPSC8_Chr03g0090591 [Helianthus annuus]|nr:hypothetical protein HanPSC8_Chr03g0090591 [Helianthus annuus]